jgi:hypothetical protein
MKEIKRTIITSCFLLRLLPVVISVNAKNFVAKYVNTFDNSQSSANPVLVLGRYDD